MNGVKTDHKGLYRACTTFPNLIASKCFIHNLKLCGGLLSTAVVNGPNVDVNKKRRVIYYIKYHIHPTGGCYCLSSSNKSQVRTNLKSLTSLHK